MSAIINRSVQVGPHAMPQFTIFHSVQVGPHATKYATVYNFAYMPTVRANTLGDGINYIDFPTERRCNIQLKVDVINSLV